jgi:hypothetical protein
MATRPKILNALAALAVPLAALAASGFWQAHRANIGLDALGGGGGYGVQGVPARPVLDKDCVLRAAAFRMKITPDAEKPKPAIHFAGETPLKLFQDSIEPQWGIRPDIILNAYTESNNKIFLIDDAAYYAKMGRFIDDSLAHEYAHYLQVIYKGIPMKEFTEWEESEAVSVQTWFRDNYFKGTPPEGAPACPKL